MFESLFHKAYLLMWLDEKQLAAIAESTGGGHEAKKKINEFFQERMAILRPLAEKTGVTIVEEMENLGWVNISGRKKAMNQLIAELQTAGVDGIISEDYSMNRAHKVMYGKDFFRISDCRVRER